MANNELPIRERFLQVYVNLPLKVRREVIVVLDEKPLTWDVAYLEIKNNTAVGDQILKKLEGLNIL